MILSEKMQELLIFTLDKNIISYKTQTVYNSHKFYETMSALKRNGFFVKICPVCKTALNDGYKNTCFNRDKEHRAFLRVNDSRKKLFKLTLKGEIMALALKDLK